MGKFSSWIPNYEQELLLRAALGGEDEAVRAWQSVKEKVSPEYAAKRLFPLVYDNLKKHGFENESVLKLKKVHRETFRDNRFLFYKTEQILQNFRQAGIETILLKGAALSLLYYRSSALRPMADIDLLIKPEDFRAASNILEKIGWRTNIENPSLLLEINPACQFLDADGGELDLHWQIMRDCWNADKTDDLWNDAVEIEIGNTPVKVLSPTHQLFHVCWHGVQYNPTPPIRWIADAITILRTSKNEINWQKLVEISRLHRVDLMIFTALDYLDKNFTAEIPPEVLRELENAPLTKMQKAANLHFLSENPMPWTRRQHLHYYAIKYLSLTSSTRRKPPILVFVKFLQYHLETSSYWILPFYAVSKFFQMFVLRRQSENNEKLAD